MSLDAILNHPIARELIEQRAREIAQRRLDAAAADLRDAENEIDSLQRQLARKTVDYERVAEMLSAELLAPVRPDPVIPFVGEHVTATPRTRLTVYPGGGAA